MTDQQTRTRRKEAGSLHEWRPTVDAEKIAAGLADRIKAGVATDAEVATALGFCIHTKTRRETWEGENDYLEHTYYCTACGIDMDKVDRRIPPFTTCLTTLAKECERRGLLWTVATQFGRDDKPPFYADAVPRAWAMDSDPFEAYAPTPALALCAALIRAVEGETK